MVDVVGVDHVCIRTDQQVAPRLSAGLFEMGAASCRRNLRGGFTLEDAGKIAGGNYMRIFRAPVG